MDRGLHTLENTKSHLRRPVKLFATLASGVLQGRIFGPLLFFIYISNLPYCVTSSTVRLFADDTVLYHGISSPADTADLHRDIESLQAWE